MKGISTKGGGGKILSLSKHSSRPLRTQIDTRKAYKLKKKTKTTSSVNHDISALGQHFRETNISKVFVLKRKKVTIRKKKVSVL